MANKLISQLGSGPFLVTDLLEHEPLAGPPSLKGNVTALFSDAASVLSIDRDNRLLIDAAGSDSLSWDNRLLTSPDTTTSIDWSDDNGIVFEKPILDMPGGDASLDVANRQLLRSDSTTSVDWDNNIIFASDGATTVLDFTTQQPSSGPATAGAVYTANEQTMIQEMYDALLAYGLLSP